MKTGAHSFHLLSLNEKQRKIILTILILGAIVWLLLSAFPADDDVEEPIVPAAPVRAAIAALDARLTVAENGDINVHEKISLSVQKKDVGGICRSIASQTWNSAQVKVQPQWINLDGKPIFSLLGSPPLALTPPFANDKVCLAKGDEKLSLGLHEFEWVYLLSHAFSSQPTADTLTWYATGIISAPLESVVVELVFPQPITPENLVGKRATILSSTWSVDLREGKDLKPETVEIPDTAIPAFEDKEQHTTHVVFKLPRPLAANEQFIVEVLLPKGALSLPKK